MFDVTAFGELLIDFTPAGAADGGNALYEQNPGGAPANVLAALAKLGRKTAFIGKVGEDAFGTFLRHTLVRAGIDVSGLMMTRHADTTLAFVHLNESGDRTFSFIRSPGADTLLTDREIDESRIRSSRIFHFGSISMTREPAASATVKAVLLAKEAGALVTFDPNLRMPLWDSADNARSRIQFGLMHADIVKLSEEELLFMTGTTDLAAGSKRIADEYGTVIVLVTMAEKGCFIRYGRTAVTVPGFRVEPQDTTGAGDAFLGGFLYQLLERDCKIENLSRAELYTMGRFANAVGALTTTRKGGIPAMPSISEIGELLQLENPGQYQEKYRPQVHFTPPANWMNDPNGLVYYEGEYHLFYQYHPWGTVWGPMHWGHAVSTDLVLWEHLPVALAPDKNGTIFSGSAVVDWNDTSGFFGGGHGLVAIFTHNDTYPEAAYAGKSGDSSAPGKGRPRQRQSLAFSTDKGRTWTMYDGNPVLSDEELTDFRDPKVFWHAPSSRWVMIIVAGDHARFYTSPNLKEWTFASEFGKAEGSHDGVWECPDLFELPVANRDGLRKWVLLVSIGDNPGRPEGSQTQYFIGDFDGTTFTSDFAPDQVEWMDYGRDNYAGVTWSDMPKEDGRRVLIGWMSNWKYANFTPTDTWRSAMTLPRELSLLETEKGIRLIQKPARELQSLRSQSQSWSSLLAGPDDAVLASAIVDAYEIEAEFELLDAVEFGFKIHKSADEETVIGYVPGEEWLFIDRTRSGEGSFCPEFPAKHGAPLRADGKRVRLRLFVDRSTVEVFAGDGAVVLTDLIFPDPSSRGLELYVKDGQVAVVSVTVHSLQSINARTGALELTRD